MTGWEKIDGKTGDIETMAALWLEGYAAVHAVVSPLNQTPDDRRAWYFIAVGWGDGPETRGVTVTINNRRTPSGTRSAFIAELIRQRPQLTVHDCEDQRCVVRWRDDMWHEPSDTERLQ